MNNNNIPQNPIPTMDIPTPSQFGGIPSLATQNFYTATTTTGSSSGMPGSTAAEIPFSIPPTTTSWDFGDMQTSQADDMSELNELDEAQIGQMLSAQGIGSWGW